MLRKMQHAKCILRATSDGCVCTGSDPAAVRHRLALDSVSHFIDTIRAMNDMNEKIIVIIIKARFTKGTRVTCP